MNDEQQDIIRQKILDIFEMWAYERGHSAGEEEVNMIYDAMVHDFEPVFKMLDAVTQL